MIDFLLNEYYPRHKDEKQYVRDNCKNKVAIEQHIRSLSDQYKMFSQVYRINRLLIKVIPITALVLFLVMPTYYVSIFVSAFSVIVLYETAINIFFPRKYYEKISSNILILKGILTTL